MVEKVICEGQFDDVETEDENESQDIRLNAKNNKSTQGTPTQFEVGESSSSDEDSSESDVASIEGVEDLLEPVENSREKKQDDQIIVVEEKGFKTGMKRKRDENIEVLDAGDNKVTATVDEKINRPSKIPDIKVSTEEKDSRKVSHSKKSPADKTKQTSAQGSGNGRLTEVAIMREKNTVNVKQNRMDRRYRQR